MARRTQMRSVKRLRVTLALGQNAVRGHCALGNPADGLAYADPAASVALIPIGTFTEDVAGDGATSTLVMLFEELWLHGWKNDVAPDDVRPDDVFSEVFLKNGATVSTSDALGTRPKAGRAMLVEDDRVYILHPLQGA